MLASFRGLCVRAARNMGGDVARYLGDGLLIAFGWPTAYEDDSRRAVRTALAIRDGIATLDLPAGVARGSVQIRIGIHTGLVVAGDLSAGDRTEHDALLGEAPNIAARIQSEAEPGTVLVSGTTATLVNPFFLIERLGRRTLRGLDQEIELVTVLRESGVRNRMETVDPSSPVLGRHQELSLLADRWNRATLGRGDAALLLGEPGIGKSRLAAEVKRLVGSSMPGGSAGPARILSLDCSTYDTASALRPVIEALEIETGLTAQSLSSDNATELADRLASRGVGTPLGVSALASLFDRAALFGEEWQRLSPERRRTELFEALGDWLLPKPGAAPLLLLIEDVHWADDTTLALIGFLLERLSQAPILLLMTARPEFQPAWPTRLRVSQIALQRLDDGQSARLAEAAAGSARLTTADIERIVARADGVPLFIEELVRELGERRPAEAPIPATLRDLLMARLDRVREARPLLEIGSLLGKTFEFGLLTAVAGRPDTETERDLMRAVEAEFLEVRGIPPLASLSFRHALIREVVHESTLRQRRSELHNRIASVMRSSFPEIVERQPEIYAAHAASGGLAKEAIDAWEVAARRATQRSAYAEAGSHYGAAVATLLELPDTPARDERELSLQVALGAQMIVARGNGAPEVEAAYRRAEALCARVDSAVHRFRAMRGLLTFFMVRGRPGEAQRIGEQLLAMAYESGDPGVRLQVCRPLGLNLFYLGRHTEAVERLDEALSLYDAQAHGGHRHDYGSDPAVLALCNRGWVRSFIGEPEAALADCQAAVDRARALDHPHSLAFALSFLASVHQSRCEPQVVYVVCVELEALANSNAFPYWATWGRVLRGWAEAKVGNPTGVAEIEGGLNAYRATGAELMVPYFAALLGEALLAGAPAAGVAGRAKRVLAEGLAISRQYGIAFYEPELLRLSALCAAARRVEAVGPSPVAVESDVDIAMKSVDGSLSDLT